jgi:FPC/CPF motif-containing protein YcgG
MQALTVFIKPDGQEHSLLDYFDQSWAMLQWLHERDPEPWPERVPLDPEDPSWSFCFGGLPLFFNFHTPAHQRRSRAMKTAFTLLVQPRDGFDVIAGNHDKGRHARQMIRDRLGVYDGRPPHPALGHYGSGPNREWQQYFLPDSDDLITEACPFNK